MFSFKKVVSFIAATVVALSMIATTVPATVSATTSTGASETVEYTLKNIPTYSGDAYIELYNNKPQFSSKYKKCTDAGEKYSKLDDLGRCGVALANICKETMPTEERGTIGAVKPSGWHTIKYNGIIDGNYLYNRCHLIGYQLAGENANKYNLITGTRYLNVTGMLSFENEVADYVEDTGNHVMYRVTPIFEDENLVASGVQLEAYSIEDRGKGISFNVYCYNVQPGIVINYKNGNSRVATSKDNTYVSKETTKPSDEPKVSEPVVTEAPAVTETTTTAAEDKQTYTFVLNTSTKKYHRSSCSYATKISDKNRDYFTGTEAELKAMGYSPCKVCID